MAGVIVGLWVGFLFVLLKLGVVKKWHLWMKVSPIVVLVVVLAILALPMNWGAPLGKVTVYQYVTKISPAVDGLVDEVTAKSLVPIKKGDPLFRINSVKYQAEVDRLAAALAEAKQDVLELASTFEAAQAVSVEAIAVRDFAKLSFEKASTLRKSNPGALSGIQVDQADLSLAEANASVRAAMANEETTRLAFKSEIDGENTTVVQLSAQLKAAQFDLSNCVVTAPADGYVPGVLLQRGQFLNTGEDAMVFVQSERADLLVEIPQNGIRGVELDQPAEIILTAFPGRTFAGKVVNILQLTPEGQITANDAIMVSLPTDHGGKPIVQVALEEGQLDDDELTGGMVGQAAIYTDMQKQSHLYRKVTLRMQTWRNYVVQ